MATATGLPAAGSKTCRLEDGVARDKSKVALRVGSLASAILLRNRLGKHAGTAEPVAHKRAGYSHVARQGAGLGSDYRSSTQPSAGVIGGWEEQGISVLIPRLAFLATSIAIVGMDE